MHLLLFLLAHHLTPFTSISSSVNTKIPNFLDPMTRILTYQKSGCIPLPMYSAPPRPHLLISKSMARLTINKASETRK